MIAPLFKNNILNEIDKQQIIEIPISGPGQSTSFEADSLVSMYNALGIAIINPTPQSSGHGQLRLRIGDDEIFPSNFHADLIAKFSPKFVNTKIGFGFKEYIFPTKAKANGKPVKIDYVEPPDGSSGKLYLYLLGEKNNSCQNSSSYRFQVISIDIPKARNSNDIEVEIDEKTRVGDNRVKRCFLVCKSNQVKEIKLCIDDNSIFPSEFQAQLITKEAVTNSLISKAGGIYTKHLIPMRYILHPTDQNAKNSDIEGKIIAVPNPDTDYKIYLYLLTIK